LAVHGLARFVEDLGGGIQGAQLAGLPRTLVGLGGLRLGRSRFLLPSRRQGRNFDYRLELKLETKETRYWLITRCVGDGIPGWKEGVVIVESV
jgi:hypothetical protein